MESFNTPITSRNSNITNSPSQMVISQKRADQDKMQNLFREGAPAAQLVDQKRYDSFYGKEKSAIADELREKMTPTIPEGAGVSVLVCANGDKKPMHLGLGTTSVQGGHSIDENTVAVIGSGAKMFTGLLSKVLEDKGILSLQTKLSDILDEEQLVIFEDREAAKNITLEMLLSHTSGLGYHADISNNDREGMTWDAILEGMVKAVATDPSKKIRFTGVPGDGVYAYSNQISLGAIFIEAAYNRAYHEANPNSDKKFNYSDILEREVILPLGMSRTGFVRPNENVLRAYRNDGGIPKSEDADIRDPVHFPAGGLWSCAADMGKLAGAFAKALKSGEGLKSSDGQLLLSPDAFVDFLKPRDVNEVSALGVDIVGSFFGKGGDISTYDFKFGFDRETGSYIVSFCNFRPSPEFGGDESDGFKSGYINHVIPTLDEMHRKFSGPESTSPAEAESSEITPASCGAPLHSCDKFFYSGKGIIGMNSNDKGWINWNGEILPLRKLGKGKFLVSGKGPHTGKTIRFCKGNGGNPYIFIETTPQTEKVIRVDAFKELQQSNNPIEIARNEEIEGVKRNRDLPLDGIVDAQGIYDISLEFGANGTTITLGIDPDSGTITVSSGERLFAGSPMVVPMTILKNSEGDNGGELWLIGNFMRGSEYMLKLSKDKSGDWQLQVLNFASKEPIETIHRSIKA